MLDVIGREASCLMHSTSLANGNPIDAAEVVEEKRTEATNFDKSVRSSNRPMGRKPVAKKSPPSAGFNSVMDRMYERTDFFAKRWGELQSLTDSENAQRLAENIRGFCTTVDKKANKKRHELRELVQGFSPQMKTDNTTLKDLRGTPALTVRMIYECAEGVPDDEKCKAAAEFVEEVLREFNHMGLPASIMAGTIQGADLSEVESTALAKYPECLKGPNITAGTIETLVKAGVDINSADERGRTALHFHAVKRNEEAVMALLKNNARLDQRDSEGKTALELATEAEAPAKLLKLLDFVELHIGLGAETAVLSTSQTAMEKRRDVVSFLKHYVRDMKFKIGERVSYFAIRIAIGVEVAENNTSWEALGRPKMIDVILGGSFREDPESAMNFLEVAARKGTAADEELRGHLENYQYPDLCDQSGETAVHKAARNNDVRKLELLDLACANLDLQDFHGTTALFIASQGGHLRAVRCLLEHWANVHLPLHTNATPLYVACQNGHLQVAQVLYSWGADANSQTNDLATPLSIANQMGRAELVKKLLEDDEILDTTTPVLHCGVAPHSCESQNELLYILQPLHKG
eukprot:s2258_g10.t1